MVTCQKKITFYQWNFTSDDVLERNCCLSLFLPFDDGFKNYKNGESKLCGLWQFHNILRRREREGGLLEKIIKIFFMMTEHSCNSKVPNVLQSSLMAN